MMHTRRSQTTLLGGAMVAVFAGGCAQAMVAAPESAPAATQTAAPTKAATAQSATAQKQGAKREVATFAAGCFWSMEAIFEQLKGVEKVEPGYAGGRTAKPSYEQVGTGKTGYAETTDITFDPTVISYRDLLEVLFTVHDPTTLNRQGADEGTQYRSAIFYRSEEQKKTAQKAIGEIAARLWKKPIVTTVQPFTSFYRAEDYHQDYYSRNPKESYCTYVIAPKMAKFREKFKSKLKS